MVDPQKLSDALKMLDHANDEHWTDDGLPRTSVVQKLAGDNTIKRSDIQAAAPEFARKIETDADGKAIVPEAATTADVPESQTDGAKGGEEGGEPMTEEEVKAILAQRVKDSEHDLTNAIANVAEAQRIVREAQKNVSAARADMQSAFPPLSAAENIKQHLARQQARLIEAHGGQPARIDQAMAFGNSRGWGRPQRQFTLPDGRVVTAGPRTQFSRKTPDLVNKRPAARA